MPPYVNLILNIAIYVVVIVAIVAIVVSKLREKPMEWPDLAQYGQPRELWRIWMFSRSMVIIVTAMFT